MSELNLHQHPNSGETTTIKDRADVLLQERKQGIYRRTDRTFAWLMIVQWIASIGIALWFSPRTWAGMESKVHPHVWAAILLGGVITIFPVWLAWRQSGRASTRHIIGIGQVLMSALLIHLTGGRIETHFHVFGSLAFLAFYRDWRVLISASVVVAADHWLRGAYWPQSVYGVFVANPWRWLEHAWWVVFEDVFLIISIRQSVQEMESIAKRQADLELSHTSVERALTQLRKQVSERYSAEEKIREQAALLEKSRDAILVRDMDQRITYWNKSAERMYGWSAAEAIGNLADNLLYKGNCEPTVEAQEQVVRKGEWIGELRQFTREDKEIVVESRWSLVRDDDGKPKSILILNTDITEKKQLESRFLRAQRMEGIGTLASGMAHDLNNVFAPILMSIRVLRDMVNNKEGDEILAAVQSSTERGANMIKQVLSFARGVEGRKTIIHVKHFTSEISQMIEDTFPKSISVQQDISEEIWNVIGDPTHLYQVVMNLCINARDAMPNGGSLKISAENVLLDENRSPLHDVKPGPYVVISVSDTGNGIAPEHIHKIFEPFFTTKDIGKGTGLGLSTALGIVKSHNGNIHVSSEPRKGSVFKIFLPAAGSTEKQRTAATQPELPVGSGQQILLVDDESSIRQVARKMLEKYGYRVLLASDGAEAVVVFVQHKDQIDAVITDMMMPNMNGAATIHALRRIDPMLPIIAASGFVADDTLAKLDAYGNIVFLHKPFDAEALLHALRKVLSEPVLKN